MNNIFVDLYGVQHVYITKSDVMHEQHQTGKKRNVYVYFDEITNLLTNFPGVDFYGFLCSSIEEFRNKPPQQNKCLFVIDGVVYPQSILNFKNRGIPSRVNHTSFEKMKYMFLQNSIDNKNKFIGIKKLDGYETIIDFLCGNCGKPDTVTYNNYCYQKQNSRGCNECSRFHLMNSEDKVKIDLTNIHKDSNLCFDNIIYNGYGRDITAICSKHGAITKKAAFFYMGNGCATCAGERSESIKLVAIDKVIGLCEKEKTFDDLRYIKKLRYDRYVTYLNMLLEYDGEQHFKRNTSWRSSKNEFIESNNRDQIKTEYAIKNGYNFIRIAYYEDHVQALESFLVLVLKHQDKQIVQIYGEVQILDKK